MIDQAATRDPSKPSQSIRMRSMTCEGGKKSLIGYVTFGPLDLFLIDVEINGKNNKDEARRIIFVWGKCPCFYQVFPFER